MKKKNRTDYKIPKFSSVKEEAKFWDTHSVTDFEDELDDVAIVVELLKPRNETLVVRVQKTIKDRMERVAAKRGVTVSTLARIWFSEKLRQTA